MPKLLIKRKDTFISFSEDYTIYLDGKEYPVSFGGVLEIDLDEGIHEIYAEVYWLKTEITEFYIGKKQLLEFNIKPIINQEKFIFIGVTLLLALLLVQTHIQILINLGAFIGIVWLLLYVYMLTFGSKHYLITSIDPV
ncbi:hypothetical protein [Aquimarina rhabdastrellae]